MTTETRGLEGSCRPAHSGGSTVGYMASRGLAKSGSRDPYSGDHGDGARR